MGFHECRISTNVTIKLKDKERVAILETGNSTLNLIFWKTRVCCVMSCNWMRSVKRKVQTTPLGVFQTNKTNNKEKSCVEISHRYIIHNTAVYHYSITAVKCKYKAADLSCIFRYF